MEKKLQDCKPEECKWFFVVP